MIRSRSRRAPGVFDTLVVRFVDSFEISSGAKLADAVLIWLQASITRVSRDSGNHRDYRDQEDVNAHCLKENECTCVCVCVLPVIIQYLHRTSTEVVL